VLSTIASITPSTPAVASAASSARARWGLYAIEVLLLAVFMISACLFTFLLEHPRSPLYGAIASPFLRRAAIGVAMGATAIVLIYNPLGKRSGALMNPAMTLTFVRLGRIRPHDAIGYIAAQFVGGAAGVFMMRVLRPDWLTHESVRFVATTPGMKGQLIAWLGEFVISFLLVTVVLRVNRTPNLAPFAGLFAGVLVASFITFEAPLSGMSMNPARTFGSAFVGQIWSGWWIYFTAPVIAMLAAVELHVQLATRPDRLCGRLSHDPRIPSMFKCNCLEHTMN
jgi:aquaporin Z